MKTNRQKNGNPVVDIDLPKPDKHKKPYVAPKVLAIERLEAAAATCEPAAPPFGKSVPMPCSALGS